MDVGIKTMMKISLLVREFTCGEFRVGHILGEAQECLAEVIRADWIAAREEFWDTAMCVQAWLYCRFSRDFEMVLPRSHIKKYARRNRVWRRIFAEHGLQFSPRYLFAGSNYTKQHKVDSAIQAARKEQAVSQR